MLPVEQVPSEDDECGLRAYLGVLRIRWKVVTVVAVVATVINVLAEEFDVVVGDSPPVLPVTDALVVSRMVDATIVGTDGRSTARKVVRRTLHLLAQVNAPVLGMALNVLPEGGQYGYRYGYGYSYQPQRA